MSRKLVLELDRAAESPKGAQEWAARFRDTLIYGGRKKNPLPFGMYCILSKGFPRRTASSDGGNPSRRESSTSATTTNHPTEEEIVAEIVAQNGREEYERSSCRNQGGKEREELVGRWGHPRGLPGTYPAPVMAVTLESATSADTGTLDSLTDKDRRPGAERATREALPAPPPQNSGEFQNVKMTTAEFEARPGRGRRPRNALIEELLVPCIERQALQEPLRDAPQLGKAQGQGGWRTESKFLTADDISRRNIEESKRQLDALMANRRAAHG